MTYYNNTYSLNNNIKYNALFETSKRNGRKKKNKIKYWVHFRKRNDNNFETVVVYKKICAPVSRAANFRRVGVMVFLTFAGYVR